MIGTSIAHYRITAKLGEGGMGEVYRATDDKLNREVALKILPEQFATDQQRMARFQREAQVLASLEHTNIGAIYGIEEVGSTKALVLQLIEGPTLADRISEGPLPVDEVLPIALQIAEALEAAHERGVIHRDLKPANIKITPEGQVKVLDFGLAKALEADPQASPDASQSPTLTMAATQAGIILGTAAYMAPEQARGRTTDRRADIWAFGAVLYELLSGRQVFVGEDISMTMAAVMKDDPDWELLPDVTPPRIRDLVQRCLRKDPRNRLRDIGDARIAIEEALRAPDEDEGPLPAAPAGGRRRWGPLVIPTVAIAALAWVIVTVKGPATSGVTAPTRLTLSLAEAERLATARGPGAVLSPDGRMLAFVALRESTPRLYVRPLDQLESSLLRGTEGAGDPFFSPDGRWIAFFAGNQLKKVSVTGGAPVVLCTTRTARGGTWGPDDTIIFSPHITSGLFRVSADGGEPVEVTTLDGGTRSDRWPQFLPGGRHVVFTRQPLGSQYSDANIAVVDLDSGQTKILHRGGTSPVVTTSGSLTYLHDGTLFAAPLDSKRLELTGDPVPILEGVAGSNSNGGAQYSVSADGHLLYSPGQFLEEAGTLLWADSKGSLTPFRQEPWGIFGPVLSPGGDRVAVHVDDSSNIDVWIYELSRENWTRLTFDPDPDWSPVWSPDGRFVVFTALRDLGRLYLKQADGSGDSVPLLTEGEQQFASSWSGALNRIAYQALDPDDDWDLWTLPIDEEGAPGKPEEFLATPFAENQAVFSPDGRWVAYRSNETGREEVFVRPFPPGAGKWQVSSEGGQSPRWAPNEQTLYYRTLDRVMEVPFTVKGNSFRAQRARNLFNTVAFLHPLFSSWDVAPDGSRFLMLGSSDGVQQTPSADRVQVNIVFNWFQELRRTVEAGN